MVGKHCSPPARGASAVGLTDYLVGYAIVDKGATPDEIAVALACVYAEAEERPDLGVNSIWAPEAGGGTRPSSILIRNCASFASASLEIDADGERNVGIRSSAMHFVWSWDERETKLLTDEQAHRCVQQVLEKLGLGHHRSVAVVHRDTDNLHVHCAVGAVDPQTGLAYQKTGLHRRMAWAEREVELTNGLQHDRGLAVVQDAGLATAHVRWADHHELAAGRAKRREDRLLRQERRSFEGYKRYDGTFERYVDVTVGPRLAAAYDLEKQCGDEPTWATQHSTAARYGCELGLTDDGKIGARDVGVRDLRIAHEQQLRSARSALSSKGLDAADIDEQIASLRQQQLFVEDQEREEKLSSAFTPLPASLRARLEELPPFQDVERAEEAYIELVYANPEIVLKNVTAQSSTFSREEVDQVLAARISDADAIERLGDQIIRSKSVRVLSVDTMHPIMTTTEVLSIEDALESDARSLAATPSGIGVFEVDNAIRAYEQREAQRRGVPFQLTSEQRSSLEQVASGSLITIEGLPGTGKTTIQGVVQIIAEQRTKQVVGLTISQAAAERLEFEAGFKSFNTARARILEESETLVVPSNGIVVVDEAAMIDSRTHAWLLDLARERGSVVLEIGDIRQIQPIDFGASFRIVREAAQKAGTYCELRDIQRQRRPWHRDAVVQLADAIVERDESARYMKVLGALRLLEQHGAITWTENRDAAIDTAIAISRARRDAGLDTLTIAADKDTVRHLSEEDRRRNGLVGRGQRYNTDGGIREFACGDRLMFLENSFGRKGLGVRNGDRGTVVSTRPNEIVVQLDGHTAKVVKFAPKTYASFDYANASTVHKSQGASVDATVPVIDRGASAELLFVSVSRSERELDIIIPRSAFANISDLAKHVTERISLKTTSHTYDELLERTGGQQTMRVLSMEAQQEAIPIRRLYEAEIVEPLRTLQLERSRQARDAYNNRKRDIEISGLSMEGRLDARSSAIREMRVAVTTAYRELKPLPFGKWLAEREERRDRINSIPRRQEHSVGRECGRDQSFVHAEQTSRLSERQDLGP